MIDLTACRSINAYPQASYPSTFYTTFSIAPYWNGWIVTQYFFKSIGTIKIGPLYLSGERGKSHIDSLKAARKKELLK
jgi:hypothetical protein